MSKSRPNPDPGLIPADVYVLPKEPRYQENIRRWQIGASVDVSRNGRIFVVYGAGDVIEQPGCFVGVASSDDGAKTFKPTQIIVDHSHPNVRLFDSNIWVDPLGRLWILWAQSHKFHDGRMGVWFTIIENPDAPFEEMKPTPPRRLGNGTMMNKPTVLRNGEWLFPCAIWSESSTVSAEEDHGLQNEFFSNVYVSDDQGKTFKLRGSADVPERSFDEHSIVEKNDGTLWMLVRCFYGIGESFSTDGGYTWSPGRPSKIDGPCSRFYIGRLKSGRLLLVNHHNFHERNNMAELLKMGGVKQWKGRVNITAFLSEDDGETWPYSLLLDERTDIAYPDAKEASDGFIYVSYDRKRVTEREILLAKITEADILAGRLLNDASQLKIIVSKATGQPNVADSD